MLEEVRDCHREILVGRQQSGAAGHDPMSVVIGVAGSGDLEAVLETDEPLHGIGR